MEEVLLTFLMKKKKKKKTKIKIFVYSIMRKEGGRYFRRPKQSAENRKEGLEFKLQQIFFTRG